MAVMHDDSGSQSPETASDALLEERTLAALDSSFPTFDSFDVPPGVVRDERAYAAHRRANNTLLVWSTAGFILIVFASALWFVLSADRYVKLIALVVGVLGLMCVPVGMWMRSHAVQKAADELEDEEDNRTGRNDPSSTNQRLMLEYHKLTRSQAEASHRYGQVAMAAGLVILLAGGVTAIRADEASAQIVAATLTTVGSMLSAYLGSTFIRAHQEDVRQINHFFGQPLVQAYVLEAERITTKVSDSNKRDGMCEQIISEVLGGASQAARALRPADVPARRRNGIATRRARETDAAEA
jgi:multisubunit Na+/H+ antiporter MnhG subunit